MLLGREEKNRLLASAEEPLALIKGVLPGDTVQVIVQAVNDGSEGVASAPVTFTVPLSAIAPEVGASEAPLAMNGDGCGAYTNGTHPMVLNG